jgi:aldose 1-epimerase
MLDNIKKKLEINSEFCGYLANQELYVITLVNNDITVKITNLGSSITAMYAPDRQGANKNIVAGYPNVTDYANNHHYLGCVLGRYAGRIAGGKYQWNNETVNLSQNENLNHLHGGFEGLNKKVWKVKSYIRSEETVGVIMQYLSEDGEEGYPGNLWIDIKYMLNSTHQLSITYTGSSDKTTPVNLSNHSYFNLSGFETGQVLNHLLQIDANYYTEKNENNVPTGKILPVKNLPFDFNSPKKIGQDINYLKDDGGYDHNYILADHLPGELVSAATLEDPVSGRVLRIYTDQPAVQLYTANLWDSTILGTQGNYYQKHGAIALETQNFPDSPNHPNFPNAMLDPNELYSSTTIYEFTVKQ